MKLYERKWQLIWEKEKVFEADPVKGKKKFFITFPYPYVNCSPHIGHSYTALRADMMARYNKMMGKVVLYPQAWHLTGEPLMGAAKRIMAGDDKQFQTFKKAGVPERIIPSFKDPKKMASYFIKEWDKHFHKLGMSTDWRRTFFTTRLNKCYNRFVTWQFLRLKDKKLVGKGSHPIIYCPLCDSPTGSHDRLKGENATIVEHLMIHFRMNDGTVLPAATLRPETTYGVTNMWINPEVVYVKAKVNDEEWIVSEQAFQKLGSQGYDVELVGEVKGTELIGKTVDNPVTGDSVYIFPASFVKPENSTGIVMSVPSHAPYDHMALEDLKHERRFKKKLDSIVYVHLIDSPGFDEHPAVRVCEMKGIISQQDVKKLENATSIVYRNEFHKGEMNKNCGSFAGKKVSESKEGLIKYFEKKGWGSRIYETSEPVVCRCTSQTHVKLLKNQWFIKYSNKAWKKKTLKCLSKMRIYPEEARKWFENAIKNMNAKACARKSGLGTPLPWDENWIIEPLSDSTIYMAYYVIAKYVNSGELKENNLVPEFFDYVLLNRKKKGVAKRVGVKKSLLDKIRKEFEYFYPVDMRSSGKDLVPHHLCFFVYNHVAFFPEKYWPKSISVNGWVTSEGEKMSKSLGNFLPLSVVIEEFGADATRLALFDTAEGLDDPDFRKDNAISFIKKMGRLLEEVAVLKKSKASKLDDMDKWLLARVQDRVEKTSSFLDSALNRQALQEAFHGMNSDLIKYLNTKKLNKKVLEYFFNVFARLMVPFAPHFSEELYLKLGKKVLVHNSSWPKVEKKFVNKEIQVLVDYKDALMVDVKSIQRLIKKDAIDLLTVVVASDWKNEVAECARKAVEKGKFRALIKEVMNSKVKRYGKRAAQLAQVYAKDANKIPSVILGSKKELRILGQNKNELEKLFGCKVIVELDDESGSEKAVKALPMKPSIILE
ncbi:MAG: leucine--tRNA ligase [Nanoarchaeota archaeon]|nr:leucine--tRNA ligase [Nanoarchaeota archaeon]